MRYLANAVLRKKSAEKEEEPIRSGKKRVNKGERKREEMWKFMIWWEGGEEEKCGRPPAAEKSGTSKLWNVAQLWSETRFLFNAVAIVVADNVNGSDLPRSPPSSHLQI